MENENMQKTYWIESGHNPDLSAAEWESLLSIYAPQAKLERQDDGLLLDTIASEALDDLWPRLGGSIRLAELINGEVATDQLAEFISTDLSSLAELTGKRLLGLGFTGSGKPHFLVELAEKIKGMLKEKEIGCRFMLPKKGEHRLSSATVGEAKIMEKGSEYLLLQTDTGFQVFRTLKIQDYKQFSERDYGRPERDMQRGMLPPKLALIMINLADSGGERHIYDPFCGVGGLLSEALALGWKVEGSDISTKAIEDCRSNLIWLIRHMNMSTDTWQVRHLDATKLSESVEHCSVYSMASEPDLGPALSKKLTQVKAKEAVKRLKPLYAAFLGQARIVLKPGARLVFLAPVWHTDQGEVELNLQREIYLSGFSHIGFKTVKTMYYARAGQKVGRRLYCLKA
jgi:tRNA G10  N-methylase Trm11